MKKRRKFGEYGFAGGGPVDSPTYEEPRAPMPEVAGSPVLDAGMTNKTMGDVFPQQESPTPKEFAEKQAVMKRLQRPSTSPLGPVSPASAPQAPAQGAPAPALSTGDRWMGELWKDLSGGYASGGHVSPGVKLYHQTMKELEAGGVAGYAMGGMVDKSRDIASQGRNGDTMLMHVNPEELEGLESLLGPMSVNPATGNPEAFAWAPALMAGTLAAPLLAAGASGNEDLGIVGGLLLGAGLAGGAMAPAAAASSAVAPGTGALASQTPQVAAQVGAGEAAKAATLANLTGASTTLAPKAGVMAPAYGGGQSVAQAAGINAVSPVASAASGAGGGITAGGVAKGVGKGLAGIPGIMKRPEMPQAPPPPKRRGRFTPPPTPYQARRMGGIASRPNPMARKRGIGSVL